MAQPRRPRVLFQEDNLLIRLSGSEPLIAAGMDVTGAEDNASARRAILDADPPFDVIVLNGRLPDGRGIPLCAELRQAGITAPVLMQSGDHYLEIFRDAMRAGVSDYLEKPWTQAEMLERVQLLLDMPPVTRRVTRGARQLAGSNISSVEAFCDERIRSAIAHLEAVRPIEGSYPVHVRDTDEDHPKDVRPVAYSEKESAELLATLKAIQKHLSENADDLEEQAKLRAALIEFVSSATSWLGKRATVVTDESLKLVVKVGLPLYIAYLAGLKIDLLHILVALGQKASGNLTTFFIAEPVADRLKNADVRLVLLRSNLKRCNRRFRFGKRMPGQE